MGDEAVAAQIDAAFCDSTCGDIARTRRVTGTDVWVCSLPLGHGGWHHDEFTQATWSNHATGGGLA
jgi:hypothetical protein